MSVVGQGKVSEVGQDEVSVDGQGGSERGWSVEIEWRIMILSDGGLLDPRCVSSFS